MELDRNIPESLEAFIQTAPAEVVRSLTVLSAAVSLTNDVASVLINQCVPSEFGTKEIIQCLQLCDFVVERNSEWHLEPAVRTFLLSLLHTEPELTKAAHSTLQTMARAANPANAGDTVPAYLTSPVGLAYHTSVFNSELGLNIYTKAFTGHHTGEQWLLGVLAEEQQQYGLLPVQAIEPAFFQGMTAYREGQWSDAERYFRRVIKSEEVRKEVAIASHLLGRILYLRYKNQEAEGLLRRSLGIEEQLGDLRGEAQVLHSLAILIENKNRQEAEEYLRRSLDLGEKVGDLRHQAQVLQSLGNVIGVRNLNQAEKFLRRSLKIEEELNHLRGQAQVLQSLAKLLSRQKGSEAEILLRRSLELEERLGNTYGQAQVLHSLAILIKRQRQDEAEILLRRSIELGEKTKNSKHLAQVLQSLGTLIGSRDWKEAEELLNRSIKINERVGDQHGQAQVLNSLGNILRRAHKWEDARSHYQRALRTSHHAKDKAIAHFGLSYVAEQFDKDLIAAIEHMKQTITFQRRTNRPDLVRSQRVRLQGLERKLSSH